MVKDACIVQTMQQSAKESIRVVAKACRQVRSSSHLKQLMRLVLATGNLLNAGTNRGNAQGFKMDTLMKLADVKVSSSRYSALTLVQCSSPNTPLEKQQLIPQEAKGKGEVCILLSGNTWSMT